MSTSDLKADQVVGSEGQSPLEIGKDVIAERGQILGEKLSEFGESIKKRGKAVYKAAKELPEDFERESKTRGTSMDPAGQQWCHRPDFHPAHPPYFGRDQWQFEIRHRIPIPKHEK